MSETKTTIRGVEERVTYHWESDRAAELRSLGAIVPPTIALSHHVLRLLSSTEILAVMDGRAMLVGGAK